MGRLSVKEYSPAAEINADMVALGQNRLQGRSLAAGKRYHFIGAGGVGISSHLTASTHAAGDAGSIHVEAPIIRLEDGAHFNATTGHAALGVDEGGGGDITVIASESLTLVGRGGSSIFRNDTNISASSSGVGPAGTIDVQAPLVQLESGAFLSSSTSGTGAAGISRASGPPPRCASGPRESSNV